MRARGFRESCFGLRSFGGHDMTRLNPPHLSGQHIIDPILEPRIPSGGRPSGQWDVKRLLDLGPDEAASSIGRAVLEEDHHLVVVLDHPNARLWADRLPSRSDLAKPLLGRRL